MKLYQVKWITIVVPEFLLGYSCSVAFNTSGAIWKCHTRFSTSNSRPLYVRNKGMKQSGAGILLGGSNFQIAPLGCVDISS